MNCLISADNPNGSKTLLADGIRTLFINGKPAVINGQRKFKNPLSWLVIFLGLPFNNIPLFSEDLTTLTISFIYLFFKVIPEPLLGVNFLLSSFIPLLT